MLGLEEPLIGRLWFVVSFDDSTTNSSFGLELHHWCKEVPEQQPVVLIEIIDVVHIPLLIEAVVAEELANVRPVLLLHVGVVVFLVRTTSDEVDFLRPVV